MPDIFYFLQVYHLDILMVFYMLTTRNFLEQRRFKN